MTAAWAISSTVRQVRGMPLALAPAVNRQAAAHAISAN